MSAESAAGRYDGTGVVRGLAYGPVRRVNRPEVEIDTSESRSTDDATVEAAFGELATASAAVAARLEERASAASGVSSEVLKANAVLARDRGWLKEARKRIAAGVAPDGAARLATSKFVAMFERLGGRQAERIADLEDVCARIIAELQGLPEPGVPEFAEPGVLMADDLAPADTAALDPSKVLAIVTEFGGPTSHTAIIARQLGIPCIVAVRGSGAIADGADVFVDGALGSVEIGVDPETARAAYERDLELRAAAARWTGPARTADGMSVSLLANVQDGAAAAKAAEGPAEGVGLFRTELAFLDRAQEPTVDEQAAMYVEVFRAFPDSKVVIRTLDAGSDKPLGFAGLAEEENPALGVRGIRIDGLDRGLVDRQLDAIAQAGREAGGAHETPQVMAPMVATVEEARDFGARCRERGISPGIMVEVPSVAIAVDLFLPHVDFLSIGTNDLTQYVMAADRMSPDLAGLTDPWQPAVLRLVGEVARAGRAHAGQGDGDGVPVGVCGEAAADPYLACVLIGLGVTSLSAAAAALPYVGAQLAEVDLSLCRQAAQEAVTSNTAADAKRQVIDLLG